MAGAAAEAATAVRAVVGTTSARCETTERLASALCAPTGGGPSVPPSISGNQQTATCTFPAGGGATIALCVAR